MSLIICKLLNNKSSAQSQSWSSWDQKRPPVTNPPGLTIRTDKVTPSHASFVIRIVIFSNVVNRWVLPEMTSSAGSQQAAVIGCLVGLTLRNQSPSLPCSLDTVLILYHALCSSSNVPHATLRFIGTTLLLIPYHTCCL